METYHFQIRTDVKKPWSTIKPTSMMSEEREDALNYAMELSKANDNAEVRMTHGICENVNTLNGTYIQAK